MYVGAKRATFPQELNFGAWVGALLRMEGEEKKAFPFFFSKILMGPTENIVNYHNCFE